MKKPFLILVILFTFSIGFSQSKTVEKDRIIEDLNEIIQNLSRYYIYLEEKNVDLNCIKTHYQKRIDTLKTEEDTVLFFEYLLDEFYDNHLTLTTHRNSSFRLFAPIYTVFENGKWIISQVWQTNIEKLPYNLIDAEIIKINDIDFQIAIENFPTCCQDKKNKEVREWIANKTLAGRYNNKRVITLRLSDLRIVKLDLDLIKLKNHTKLLTSKIMKDVGVIRINNSLGNDNLVTEFDKELGKLLDTKGIIIDLRNTVFGGDSYEARGIMSRFINEPKPYQKHSFIATSPNNPNIERSWVEYVTPRLETYKKPILILVGRWTGSMGEGLAIGFEGMKRGPVVGTKMRRLAGEVYDFSFKHQRYKYKIATTKLFHLNGTLREDYIPTHYIKQTTTQRDEILEKAIKLIIK
ncbi:S41 family peptidase [Ascidiimonas sp. W6]|uniref:S41 family peptidase n=1 Tax=Ascidiimonas meishanensis TaxID=3128903 RepID=UPI0030ED8A69